MNRHIPDGAHLALDLVETRRSMSCVTASYRRCRALARAHGTTYFWAAQLLPAPTRRHVHAIYAFCRVADDIIDEHPGASAAERGALLQELGRALDRDLRRGRSDHPILAAVVDTAIGCRVPAECFDRFLRSMAMDLERTAYDTWEDLLGYMDGSAAVIGEMMLPVLVPDPPAELREPARALGNAFQLTNFLRDVGEDLDRGRVYLPQEDLRRFGVDPHRREVTDRWRDLMQFEFRRCEELYELADVGIAALPGRSARCVGTARRLYSRILDRIAGNDYDVFTCRARVPLAEKLVTAGWRLVRPSPATRT